MGALATTPHLRKIVFMFRLLTNQNFGADECVAFLRQLLANITGKIILVWDNFLPHKSVKVKNLIKVHSRLSIEFLPPYAPELNPVEGLWSHLKMNKMANYCPRSLEDLEMKTKKSFCNVRSEKQVIKKIFHHALSKTRL